MSALDIELEIARQCELEDYQILDTPPEDEFDDFTRLASQICGTPIALISLLDNDRQWFKSKIGLQVTETPRSVAFCNYAIASHSFFEVPDALSDARFKQNPLVIGDPKIRFYAGAPLSTARGHSIGTLCVIDRTPRRLTSQQRNALMMLSRQVVARLELHKANVILAQQGAFHAAILRSAGAAIITTTPNGVITHFNPQAEKMLGYKEEEMIGRLTPAVFHDPGEVAERAAELSRELGETIMPGFEVFVRRARSETQSIETREWTYVRKNGSTFPALLSVSGLRDKSGHLFGFLGVARDISERKQLEYDLVKQREVIQRQSELLAEIKYVQDKFIRDQTGIEAFDHLLRVLVKFTRSDLGVVCEISQDTSESRRLQMLCFKDQISAHEEEYCLPVAREPGAEILSLVSAIESVVATGTLVVSEIEGSPGPNGLGESMVVMGVPIFNDKELVGVVGIANRSESDSRELVEEIAPLIATMGNLILARHTFLLRNVAEERVQAQDVLLVEKQNLLQEVHHRVKNNLQVVSSLLALQQRQSDSPAVVAQLCSARGRLSAVALLHEILYRSDSAELIDLQQFLNELMRRLRDTFGEAVAHINLSVEAPSNLSLSHRQAGPLALIINELATNSFKHAFSDQRHGSVAIKATVSASGSRHGERLLHISVEDDGKGFSTPGHETRAVGLGMQIVDRLSVQLGGKLVQQSAERGTKWELTIPLN